MKFTLIGGAGFIGSQLMSYLPEFGHEVKVIDTSETLGDQNVRIVMRMTAGCQYGNITEIVTYGITNSAND